MEHGLPPSAPNTAPGGQALIDLLAQLDLLGQAPLHGAAARPSLVDGLGRWLGWADAIPLSAALQAAPPATLVPARDVPGVARQAGQGVQRVRAALLRAIDGPGAASPDSRYLRQSMTAAGAGTAAAVADFSPHRQRHGRLQQAMEAAITPLRAQLRATAAPLSPALSRLAALDAVMAQRLGGREQALLAMMPSLLQRHFERLHAAHLQAPAQPATWLARFQADMKRLLLAELDLRLQPAWGLLCAINAHAGLPTPTST